MSQACYLLVKISLILVFGVWLVNCVHGNVAEMEDDMFVAKDVGYKFLQAYRSVLANGWFGNMQATTRNVTPECRKHVKSVTRNPQLLMQYLDAVGKPKSGLLRLNLVWLGSYSECRDIPSAQYCKANLALAIPNSKPIEAKWGLCFPSRCTEQDITVYLSEIFKEVQDYTGHLVNPFFSDVKCPPVKPTYTTGVKATFAFCGFLLLLCLIGTAVDVIEETFITEISNFSGDVKSMVTIKHESTDDTGTNDVDHTSSRTADDVVLLKQSSIAVKAHYMFTSFKASFPGQFFKCFSILENTSKIFKTDVPPTAITSINGIRVISMTWVIIGHVFSSFFASTVENRYAMGKDSQLLSLMAIISGTYSVDSFFFLSGLLVAYTCFRKLQKNDGSFNWFLFYFHRFWRLTPSYMFVILFSIHLKGFLTEGPFWETQLTDPLCSKYWWTNLLYVNNFYPKGSKVCIGWSWYLANDMQFFVITPFLILPLLKAGWRGVVLPLGLLIECSIITGFIIGHWDIDSLAIVKIPELFQAQPNSDLMKSLTEYMSYVYIKPYCRIQVYLVGFLVGYVFFRYNNSKTRRPGWILTLVGWSAAIVLGMLLVYGPHKSILPGAKDWNKAENVLFGTFQRFLWALSLAWVTYACHYRAGGLVQKFLSAKFWIPLSRLTYNVYLIHIIIITLMITGSQGTIHYDLYTASYYYLATVMLSYGAAYILAAVIEFPCANLEELMLKYIRRARKRGD